MKSVQRSHFGDPMQFPAVNWHEGLFLQPQHFQAWDRHWTERVAAGEQYLNPNVYGLAEISINTAALAAGFIQLDTMRARTPGGALLELATGQQSERRDLRPALQASSLSKAQFETADNAIATIDVFIGVPRLRLGGANVQPNSGHVGATAGSTNGQPANGPHSNGQSSNGPQANGSATSWGGSRFTSELFELPDEVDASSVQSVELRRVNVHILLEGEDLSGYDTLPIARIRRGEDSSSFELDDQFVPPLLDCGAWPAMRSQILSPISDLILRTSEQVGQAIADAASSLQANSPAQLRQLLLMQAINPAAAVLRVISTSRGIHPQTAYLELAKLAGALDFFLPERTVKPIRAYDHDALGPLFWQLKRRIVTVLSTFDSKPYFQKFLIGDELGMHTTIDSVPGEKVEWFVGIYKGKLPLAALHQLLSAGHLDWKVGSARQVESLFTQRAPGVELQPATELPSVLPRGQEWAYFKVDPSGAAWQDVMASKSLAIRVKDSMIAEPHTLPGNRQILISHENHSIPLRFALFGVAQS